APLNAAARRLRQAWRGARQNAGMTTQNTPTSPRLAGHALVEALIAQGVDTVFGVPGESYLAVLDGFHEHAASIRFIACRQEGGA
ncbi:thiamine pyrophosphate-binding protein, partial [Vibrio parahaemolyticus]